MESVKLDNLSKTFEDGKEAVKKNQPEPLFRRSVRFSGSQWRRQDYHSENAYRHIEADRRSLSGNGL